MHLQYVGILLPGDLFAFCICIYEVMFQMTFFDWQVDHETFKIYFSVFCNQVLDVHTIRRLSKVLNQATEYEYFFIRYNI